MWDNGVELIPSMVDGQFSSAIKLPSEVVYLKIMKNLFNKPLISRHSIGKLIFRTTLFADGLQLQL